MAESKSKKLPQFSDNQALMEFFETHDMGEFEGELPEVHFEVNIKRNHYLVSIDRNLMNRLLEEAKGQQVSVELLINSWLKDKLMKAS